MLKKITLIAALAGAFFSGTLHAEALKYAGSDFLAGSAETVLKEELKKSAALQLQGELLGSKVALEQLRKGEIDFAMIMLADADSIPEFKDKTWRANALGYQVCYLVVPQSNPVEELSIFQLRGIFANFSESPLNTWNEISDKVTGSPKIHRVVSTENDNAGGVIFQSLVFPRAGFNKDLRKTATDEDAIRAVLNTSNAIALTASPPVGQPTLKTLAISPANKKDETNTAYSPTPANIYNRDYPLSVQFMLVYPTGKREKMIPVIKTILSDPFAKALEKTALTPLPKNIRDMLKKNIDDPKK